MKAKILMVLFLLFVLSGTAMARVSGGHIVPVKKIDKVTHEDYWTFNLMRQMYAEGHTPLSILDKVLIQTTTPPVGKTTFDVRKLPVKYDLSKIPSNVKVVDGFTFNTNVENLIQFKITFLMDKNKAPVVLMKTSNGWQSLLVTKHNMAGSKNAAYTVVADRIADVVVGYKQ